MRRMYHMVGTSRVYLGPKYHKGAVSSSVVILFPSMVGVVVTVSVIFSFRIYENTFTKFSNHNLQRARRSNSGATLDMYPRVFRPRFHVTDTRGKFFV
jgi:hypothetical protein